MSTLEILGKSVSALGDVRDLCFAVASMNYGLSGTNFSALVSGIFSVTAQIADIRGKLAENSGTTFSYGTQRLIKKIEYGSEIVNLVANMGVACEGMRRREPSCLEAVQELEKFVGRIAQLGRLEDELIVIREKQYLSMSPEEMAKATRPLIYTAESEHGERYRIYAGERPVNREECQNLLDAALSHAQSEGVVEVIGKSTAVSAGVVSVCAVCEVVSIAVDSVYDMSCNLLAACRHLYRQLTERDVHNLIARHTIPELLYNDPVLQQYICPITQVPIRHPVMDPNGITLYERTAIEAWIDQAHTSPVTGLHLNREDLLPAPLIEQIINTRLEALQVQLDEI